MTRASAYLSAYAADHQNPVNRRLHTICVPIIVVSLLGLLWSVPVPVAAATLPTYVNWAGVTVVAALLWYLLLAPRLALGMAVGAALALAAVAVLDRLESPLWMTSAALFLAAWAGQFVGHAFEGRRPSFLRDLRFLLIGPLWVMSGLYARLGIPA